VLFNSIIFVVFFAVVLALYGAVRDWQLRKIVLLLASYLFYSAWNPYFVFLLLAVSVLDFQLSRLIHRSENPRTRWLLLALSLGINFGALAFFKYGNFFIDNLRVLAEWLRIPLPAYTISVILPLGISFYTFETVSYLIDVYRRKLVPTDSFLDYALFLTFFPHLVAGPIVRAGDFLPQCEQPRSATPRQFGWGLTLMTCGLFLKVVCADALLTPVVLRTFSASGVGFLDSWIGVLAFSGQIYCDFAGYSACGIGAALCLGWVLNDNFHCPYAAIGFSDFWRRWHISLSSWLRDYLYIPLGGNRHGVTRTQVNLMLTMLLGGLWHGASWQFVVWGGLHGAFLILERLLVQAPFPDWFRRWSGTRYLACLGTFLLVSLAWVFFRATTFASACEIAAALFVPDRVGLVHQSKATLATTAVVVSSLVAGQWLLRDSCLEHCFDRMPWWLIGIVLALMLTLLVLTPGDNHAFIYFQF
jgi:alginate O-acetyltransferase complex protein AlgI